MSTHSQLPGFSPDPVVAKLPRAVQVYVVGGAVRDVLLGLPVHDKDWVVVGATAQQMLDAGFTPVGADFPVFLHPITHEEYALARTERKSGRGYAGFTFHADPWVTLEQDLLRRDLTINAMAVGFSGQLLDPYGGQRDLQARLFRHVSPAFAEDPLRVLRLARFLARFVDFQVAPETMALCSQLLTQGELDYLVPERLFTELDRGMACQKPSRMVKFLAKLGAWRALAKGQAEPFSTLDASGLDAINTQPLAIERWALALASLPVPAIDSLAQAWRMPKDVQRLAVVTRLCSDWLGQTGLIGADSGLELLSKVDVFRKPEELQLAVQLIARTQKASRGVMFLQQAAQSVINGQFKQGLRAVMQAGDAQQIAAAYRLRWAEQLWLLSHHGG